MFKIKDVYMTFLDKISKGNLYDQLPKCTVQVHGKTWFYVISSPYLHKCLKVSFAYIENVYFLSADPGTAMVWFKNTIVIKWLSH